MSEGGQEGESATPSTRGRSGVEIFICDASAEAGRLLTGLQAKGYAIADVPLGLLPSRVLYEVPQLVICDADAREARGHLTEMIANAQEEVAILLLGHEDGALSQDRKLVSLARDALTRPVDIEETIQRIVQIAGPPSRSNHHHRVGRSGRAPILVASARKPYRSDAEVPAPSGRASVMPDDERIRLTSPVLRGPQSDLPRFPEDDRLPSGISSVPSHSPPSSDRLSISPETQAVLNEGRKRVAASPHPVSRHSRLPRESQETGGDIRREFADALLEPLDLGMSDAEDERENDRETGAGTEPPPKRNLSSRPAPMSRDELTNPGGRREPIGSVDPSSPPAEENSGTPAPDSLPLLEDLSDLLKGTSPGPPLPGTVMPDVMPAAPTGASQHHTMETVLPPHAGAGRDSSPTGMAQPPGMLSMDDREPDQSRTDPPPPPTSRAGPALEPFDDQRSPEANTSDSWEPMAALQSLARAVRERHTGALAQQEGGGIRRTVFVDGDISTVTSSIGSESLAHFLHARGDFQEEVLESLGSLPKFGRHAGAALIARGLLAQDDLWPVLRAHAEWILGHSIRSAELTHWEGQVHGRVSEEPAVFGGAAGAEIYLEAVRRVVSPKNAMVLLGGGEQRLSVGTHESLMGESALSQDEQDIALEALGRPLSLFEQEHPDLLPVLLGLSHLRILSAGGHQARPSAAPALFKERNEEVDDKAFAARVETRRALVEDGDYFSILGVPRSATRYEIDRARDKLLQEYSDERLNARTIHLAEDLVILRNSIDEAHMVLCDDLRRLRYRTALEALPV